MNTKVRSPQTEDLQPTMLPKWVRGNLYSSITGLTDRALEMKRSSGKWAQGIHYMKAPDGCIYYNWRAIDEWIEGNG